MKIPTQGAPAFAARASPTWPNGDGIWGSGSSNIGAGCGVADPIDV